MEEVLNVKSVSEPCNNPLSPNMEDAPSEQSCVEGRLAQLDWENKIVLDQAVVTKQRILNHAEHIRQLERTLRAICGLILESQPKEEEPRGGTQKPTGAIPQVGLPLPPEVIMRRESFPMQPTAPQPLERWQGLANPPTGLLPTPATLMAGEPSPIPPPAAQLLAQLDARYIHSHRQHHHQHHRQHHQQHHPHQMAPVLGYGHGGHGSQPWYNGGSSYAPAPAFGQCMLGSAEAPSQGFGQSLLGSSAPAQGIHLAIEGPQPPYATDTDAGVCANGQIPPTEAAVTALHFQRYGGGGWNAPRATGTTANPTVLANGLADAQTTEVMANIPMPECTGSLEDLGEFERTWNKYAGGSSAIRP